MKTDNQAITTEEYVDRKTAAELTEKVTGEIMEQLTAEYQFTKTMLKPL